MTLCQESKEIKYHLVKKKYSKQHGGYELNKKQFFTTKLSANASFVNLILKDLEEKHHEKDILLKHSTNSNCCDEIFLFYENDKTEDTIVLWKLDGEYYSQIYFFHFKNEKMSFLGEIHIGEDCVNEGCEAFNVSKEKIHVSKKHDFISVLFKGKNTFFSKEISPNGSLTSENLTLHFRLLK